MLSMNNWIVKGKIVNILENKKGYWIKIEGIANNSKVFKSDTYTIDCWILKKNLPSIPVKKEIALSGKFMFKKQECYFVADKTI